MLHCRSSYAYFEEHNKGDSVYHLITFLCENLCNNAKDSIRKIAPHKLIKKCRSKAYEILLKRIAFKYCINVSINPLDQLEKLLFSLTLKANTKESKFRIDCIAQCIDEIQDMDFVQYDKNGGLLTFVLYLMDTKIDSCPLVLPTFVDYPIPQISKLPYPIFPADIFKMPKKCLVFDESIAITKNPYLETFLKFSRPHYTDYRNAFHFFTNTFEKGLVNYRKIQGPENEVNKNSDCFTTALEKSFECEDGAAFQKFKKLYTQIPEPTLCDDRTNNFEILARISKQATIATVSTVPQPKYNWECLGSEEIIPEEYFLSECDSIHYATAFISNNNEKIQIISYENFIRDAKKLTIGLPSYSFIINDDNEFILKPNLAVSQISQSTLSGLVEGLIELGVSYSYLNLLITENPYNQKFKFDGFIYRVLCKCLQKYLFLFRKFVVTHEDNSLLKFFNRISIFRMQIITINKILQQHFKDTPEHTLTSGSIFIKYLFKEMSYVFDQKIRMVLIYILKKCCDAYYIKFEKWLFHGHLDDPHKELFLHFKNCYRPNTKAFFDKAFYICDDIIPSFLQGYEKDMLLCGKYTMLLKLFKPTHPLFSLKPPQVRTALSYDALNALKKSCIDYSKRGLEICGKSISIRELFIESKRQYDLLLDSINAKKKLKMNSYLENKYLQSIEKEKTMYLGESQQPILPSCDPSSNDSQLFRQIDLNKDGDKAVTITVQEDIEIMKNKHREKIFEYHTEIDMKIEENTYGKKITNAMTSSSDIPSALNPAQSIEDISNSSIKKDAPKLNSDRQHNKMKSENSNIFYNSDALIPHCRNMSNNIPMSALQTNRLRNMSHSYGMVKTDLMESYDSNRPNVKHLEYGYYNIYSTKNSRRKIAASQIIIEDVQELESEPSPKDTQYMHIEYGFRDLCSSDVEADITPLGTDTDSNTLTLTPIASKETLRCNSSNDSINSKSYKEDPIYLEYIRTLAKYRKLSDSNLPVSKYNPFAGDMKNLDMPSLTRFLQLSISFPLQTHIQLVNGEIMKLFLKELDIIGHIKCLRQYFFHMNGEFGNLISDELFKLLDMDIKPRELLTSHALRSALDNAVECSKIGVHKYAHHLSFHIEYIPDTFNYKSPNILDMLSLNYYIEWPLNLLLTQEALFQYSKVFNYLMKLKRLSWVLEDSFQYLKETSRFHGRNIQMSADYRQVQHIRHKFSTFIYALQNHITWSALHVGWKLFEDNIKTAKTMDDIHRIHEFYIERIIALCMMNEKCIKFYNTFENIFSIIIGFCMKLKANPWCIHDKNKHIIHPKLRELKDIEKSFDGCVKYIIFLGESCYQKEIGNLIQLININLYYSSSPIVLP